MVLDRFFAKTECWYQKCRPLIANLHATVKAIPVQAAKVVKFYTPFKALKTISCSEDCSGGTRPFRPNKRVPWGEKQVFNS